MGRLYNFIYKVEARRFSWISLLIYIDIIALMEPKFIVEHNDKLDRK